MLYGFTIKCQVTMIIMNLGPQLSEMSAITHKPTSHVQPFPWSLSFSFSLSFVKNYFGWQMPQNVMSYKDDKYHVCLIYWVTEKSLRRVLGKLCQADGRCNGWSVTTDNFQKREKKIYNIFFGNCGPLCFYPSRDCLLVHSPYNSETKGDQSINQSIFMREKILEVFFSKVCI